MAKLQGPTEVGRKRGATERELSIKWYTRANESLMSPKMRPVQIWRVLFVLSFVGACQGQAPLIAYRGIYNAASNVPGGLPAGAIARGSIFTITGKNLGPASTPDLSDPLATTLGEVSITVTQGSTTVNAIPLTLSAGAVTAIMPSNAPMGAVSLRLTYKNVRSNPMPVRVTASQFGIYTANTLGNGPARAQNDNGDGTTTGNTLQTPAHPGQTVYLPGTGLGAVPLDTAANPDTSNLTVKTEVFVGGVSAQVLSNGRRGPGADQIGFVIPDAAPGGCWTPVYVRTAGTAVSNFATLSISADGSPCQEPNNVLANALINGGNIGSYAAARINMRHDAGARTPRDATTDMFGAYEAQEVAGPANFNPMFSLPPAGTCTAYTAFGDLTQDPTALIGGFTPPTGNPLDSGGATLTGDKGSKTAQQGSYPGMGVVQLGGAIPSLPLTNRTFLDSGGGTAATPGGNDIGSSSTDSPVPQPFTWTNRDQVLAITLSKGLTVNWSGGDPASSTFIVVAGVDLPANASAAALCIVPQGNTSFTVPPDVLANLPVTHIRAVQSRGVVYVGQWNIGSPASVSAAGLDFGAFVPIFAGAKTVSFQ